MNDRAQAAVDPMWPPITAVLVGFAAYGAWVGDYRFAAGAAIASIIWVALLLVIYHREKIFRLDADGGSQ